MPAQARTQMVAPTRGLEKAVEDSLTVCIHRAGTNTSHLQRVWQSHPHATIGQTVGHPIQMEFENSRSVRVDDGCGYVLPPNLRHRSSMALETVNTFHWAHVTGTLFGSLDLFQLLDIPVALPRTDGIRLGKINRALARTGKETSALKATAERKRLGMELFSIILSRATLRPRAQILLLEYERMLPVLRYIEENFTRPIERNELARVAHLSPSRFHHVFKRASGKAPVAYLLERRLRRAQELLVGTDQTITEVCEASGFRDPFHFSRQFKAFTKLSPRNYRRQRKLEVEQLFSSDIEALPKT